MFRLVRWLLWLAFFAGVYWVGSTVMLGKRTLFGHLHAIFTTREAKDLADGTKQEAHHLAEKLRDDKPQPSPLDPLAEKERRALDKLVKEKTHKK